MTDVLSAEYFTDNADIIEKLFELGYLRREMKVLDPTYGGGNWWTKLRPKRLVKHDLILDGVDFRNTPHRDDSFDAASYDPPYVSIGGRKTAQIKAMYQAYGLLDAPTSPVLLQQLINAGLVEMFRVVKPGGIVLCKCQDYISSGHLWSGTFFTERFARSIGYEVEAKFVHVKKSGGPQPKERTRKCPTCKDAEFGPDSDGIVCITCKGEGRIASVQKHPRNNASMMLVLRIPKRKDRKKMARQQAIHLARYKRKK